MVDHHGTGVVGEQLVRVAATGWPGTHGQRNRRAQLDHRRGIPLVDDAALQRRADHRHPPRRQRAQLDPLLRSLGPQQPTQRDDGLCCAKTCARRVSREFAAGVEDRIHSRSIALDFRTFVDLGCGFDPGLLDGADFFGCWLVGVSTTIFSGDEEGLSLVIMSW